MQKIVVIILLASLSGCSYFKENTKTTVSWDDGEEVKISSKPDSLVTVKTENGEVTVDLRGRPTLFQLFVEALLLRGSGVSKSDQEIK